MIKYVIRTTIFKNARDLGILNGKIGKRFVPVKCPGKLPLYIIIIIILKENVDKPLKN